MVTVHQKTAHKVGINILNKLSFNLKTKESTRFSIIIGGIERLRCHHLLQKYMLFFLNKLNDILFKNLQRLDMISYFKFQFSTLADIFAYLETPPMCLLL